MSRCIPASSAVALWASAVLFGGLSSSGCDRRTTAVPCACESVEGHGVSICDPGGEACGPCQCLESEAVEPDGEFAAEFWVDAEAGEAGDGSTSDPWSTLDWDALDEALTEGDVAVWFSSTAATGGGAETWDAPLEILRSDDSDHRLVIDGRQQRNTDDQTPAWQAAEGTHRARIPGVTTPDDGVKRSFITVRGFELADSTNQGVYWSAGDGVVLEDLVIHDNGSSPALYFEYANRVGAASTDLTIRNNHLYDVRGECIYVGGAEGEPFEAHQRVVIANNLVHHCGAQRFSGKKWDGINVKDRLDDVWVRGNVVFATHHGLEVGSTAVISGNLVFDTAEHGILLSDEWGVGHNGARLDDNVVIDARGHGLYLGADLEVVEELPVDGLTVVGARDAAVLFAGDAGLDATVRDVVLAQSGVAVDGWGSLNLTVADCVVWENDRIGQRKAEAVAGDCADSDPGFVGTPLEETERLAGDDGVFFTDDDAWRTESGVGAY